MRIKEVLNTLNNGCAIVAVDQKAAEIFRSLVASGKYFPFGKLKIFQGRRYVFFITEEFDYKEIRVMTYRHYLQEYQKDTPARRAEAEAEAEADMEYILKNEPHNHYGADVAYNSIIREYENSLRKEVIFVK